MLKEAKARDKRSQYGAGDTEPRVVMTGIFRKYLSLYLDEWDFPDTFEAVYDYA